MAEPGITVNPPRCHLCKAQFRNLRLHGAVNARNGATHLLVVRKGLTRAASGSLLRRGRDVPQRRLDCRVQASQKIDAVVQLACGMARRMVAVADVASEAFQASFDAVVL